MNPGSDTRCTTCGGGGREKGRERGREGRREEREGKEGEGRKGRKKTLGIPYTDQ